MIRYKAIIIDDDINNISNLRCFIYNYGLDIEVIGEVCTINEALSLIEKYSPDILFMDVQINGKEVFELLDQIKMDYLQLIFITYHAEYALKAIKYNPIDYILKPLTADDFIVATSKAIDKLEQNKFFSYGNNIPEINNSVSQIVGTRDYIAVASYDKIEIIKVSDIVYMVSDSKYATFHLINGKKHISNKNLIYYELILDRTSFFRIHKSYIINISYTTRIIKKDGSYCELLNGILLPIAKRKKDELNRFLKIKE